LYGWFSALMCLCSIFGAIAWMSLMFYTVALFKGVRSPRVPNAAVNPDIMSLNAQGQHWLAVYFVAYAIEFMCLSVVKFVLLERMAHFMEFDVPLSKGIIFKGRIILSLIMLGNSVGLCGNVAAAVFGRQSGEAFSALVTACNANSTACQHGSSNVMGIYNEAFEKASAARQAASVQSFCEVVLLLVIIVTFIIFGIRSARFISRAVRIVNSKLIPFQTSQNVAVLGAALKRRIVGTTTFVFLTFMLRAVFSITNSLSNLLQNNGSPTCAVPVQCSSACFNQWQLMQEWIQFTPEFTMTAELISSPLALIVALWGVTDATTLRLLRS
jgi:hypothetical protein